MAKKNKPKLISAGCSFSDYLQNNRTVYGKELSQLLDRNYMHQGAGAGSNWRIWRVIGQAVMQGLITDRDIVTVQYTGIERREFWSSHRAEKKSHSDFLVSRRDSYADGDLIRYKAMAWTWQDHERENEFLQLYEEHHVCVSYEQEWFDLQHYQFQLLLQQHRIPCVFIIGRHRPLEKFELIEPFSQWQFQESEDFQRDTNTWNSPADNSHLCDHGHRQLAEMLFQHIRALGL